MKWVACIAHRQRSDQIALTVPWPVSWPVANGMLGNARSSFSRLRLSSYVLIAHTIVKNTKRSN